MITACARQRNCDIHPRRAVSSHESEQGSIENLSAILPGSAQVDVRHGDAAGPERSGAAADTPVLLPTVPSQLTQLRATFTPDAPHNFGGLHDLVEGVDVLVLSGPQWTTTPTKSRPFSSAWPHPMHGLQDRSLKVGMAHTICWRRPGTRTTCAGSSASSPNPFRCNRPRE